MAGPLQPGAPAPDFVLLRSTVYGTHLSDLRGQPLVLAFGSGAGDVAGGDQIALYNHLLARTGGRRLRLRRLDLEDGWCRLEFAQETIRLPFIVEPDSGSAVAAAYGISGRQAWFVIDGEGLVRWCYAVPLGGGPPSGDLVTALETVLARPSQPWQPTRREFVAAALAATLALAAGIRAEAREPQAILGPAPLASRELDVSLRVNGREIHLRLEPRVTLLDALREYAGLPGTKKGCDHGQCGACTVHVDGRRVLSCLTFAVMQQGRDITTIEGLAAEGERHPMQAAFIEHDGFQCGYCTPGQIMSAVALLREPCGAADGDVRECMSGNLCRCGAYPNIVAAVQQVRGANPRPG